MCAAVKPIKLLTNRRQNEIVRLNLNFKHSIPELLIRIGREETGGTPFDAIETELANLSFERVLHGRCSEQLTSQQESSG